MTATPASHKDMANAIRALAMDAVQRANSGHPGMPMGMADAATVLFSRFLKFDPADPHWPDRDRFVLSAGHGSMLLYALLYLTGYAEFDIEALKNFRQLGSATAGHPEYGHGGGIETTTGPLGQGIANAVGMAIAERHLAARFGAPMIDHHIYVIAGDGCLMEGISHEAASLAGHLKLDRLIVLYDSNDISIDGPTSLALSDDAAKRFAAYGWDTQTVNGHDPEAVARALEAAKKTTTPSLIICRTTIAYGAPTKAGTADSHGSPLGEAEIKGAREKLGWPHAPFEVPMDILAAWRAAGARGAVARKAWQDRLAKLDGSAKNAFDAAIQGDVPADVGRAIDALKQKFSAEKPALATRVSSQRAIEVIAPALPSLLGGSADLTGSNGTKVGSMAPLKNGAFDGRYVYYGVREHGMAAAMNGMALHGGAIPFGGTFLVFTDYCRPSIRLSALMGVRVIYVMTHDSIGLGEDGPTHQPVEHLASLRAMPNLLVLRPADAVETAECWQIALDNRTGPSVLALTRQNLPTLRTEHKSDNLAARGGYVLSEADGGAAKVVLIGTGSEVALAVEAKAALEAAGTPTRVVSMPSFELFDRQPADYRTSVLGGDVVRIGIEAAVGFGWERYIGARGAFVGMASFGASAPIKALYQHFGITVDAIVKAARARL
ncbi:MAG: transketolase [Alphaproteobacteria bacterium]|nr:transketolase [Alphaproteobacteria bacterium]